MTRRRYLRIVFLATLAICSLSMLAGDTGANVHNGYDERDASWTAWRTPDRDAVNCLYILLKCAGDHSSYQGMLETFGGDRRRSLLEIRNVANTLGLDASVYRCTPDSLRCLNSPAIVHMEAAGAKGGSFAVVLPTHNESAVNYIDGYTTVMDTAAMDEFQRHWDGFILILEHEGVAARWVWAMCLCLVYVLIRLVVLPHCIVLRPR